MIATAQKLWKTETGWIEIGVNNLKGSPQLVLVFGAGSLVSKPDIFAEIKVMYPNATILMCSSAGEIIDTKVTDGALSLTAIAMEKTKIVGHIVPVLKPEDSLAVGQELASMLDSEKLVHALVFSDGLRINGSALVQGLTASLPKNVNVTGGLVGDGSNFKHTFLGLDSQATEGKVALLGFYSDNLKVGFGSMGGWDPFGPERLITKSKGNILYELDDRPALELYKEYLGEKAKDLPSSGLLFPLSLTIKTNKGAVEVVRTVLGVNEADKSLTFAGDMPQGTPAKLMRANFDRLIDGASGAANMSLSAIQEKPELAILISCIGRKLVLKERVEEELDAIREKIGSGAICGLYSYGEIGPTIQADQQCQLHNQTMTVTIFKES